MNQPFFVDINCFNVKSHFLEISAFFLTNGALRRRLLGSKDIAAVETYPLGFLGIGGEQSFIFKSVCIFLITLLVRLFN